MIIINNPKNPTGAVIPSGTLSEIVRVAQEHDLILFSDEVYRLLFHGLPQNQAPPSVISMGYNKVLVTSSMSDAWALAGIRVGWNASPDPSIIATIARARDYRCSDIVASIIYHAITLWFTSSKVIDLVALYCWSKKICPVAN
jgi:aspartate/methionine/tyrosine aminotransferase